MNKYSKIYPLGHGTVVDVQLYPISLRILKYSSTSRQD